MDGGTDRWTNRVISKYPPKTLIVGDINKKYSYIFKYM